MTDKLNHKTKSESKKEMKKKEMRGKLFVGQASRKALRPPQVFRKLLPGGPRKEASSGLVGQSVSSVGSALHAGGGVLKTSATYLPPIL